MPELLWKAYIDFETEEGEREKARALYERLIELSGHVKVWISYATFEAEPIPIPRAMRDEAEDEDEDILGRQQSMGLDGPVQKKPRKKRPAARKGWKGWVEGSPPPSEKLINLDSVTVLAERKTRSGKSFDAIGAGRDGWV